MARRVMLIVAVLASAAAPANALAATITVNTTADAEAVDGLCTLREAIRAANTDTAPSTRAGECAAGSGADTIMLSAGTYALAVTGPPEDNDASGDLDIRGPTTIDGAGAAATTIDASAAHDRALQILPGANATVQGVMITGGVAPNGADGASQLGAAGGPGGGGSGASGGDGEPGGGIRNDGTLSVIDTIITGNRAGAGGRGGNGTGGAGDTSTNGSNGGDGDGGPGGNGGSGGGVFSDGTALTLTRTVLSGNIAGFGGVGGRGMGGQGGAATTGNAGAGGDGQGGRGGSGGSGGAVGQQGLSGSVTVLQSSITRNLAGGGGPSGDGDGGLGGGSGGNDGGAGGTGAATFGGLGGNGGGIDAVGALIVSGDLISANLAGRGGRAGAGVGGPGGAAAGPNGVGGAGGDGGAIVGGTGGSGGGIHERSVSATNDTIVGNFTGVGGDGGTATGGDGGPILDAGTNGRGGDASAGVGGDGGSGGGLSRSLLGAGDSLLLHATIAGNALSQGGDQGLFDPGARGIGGTGGNTGLGHSGSNGERGVGGGVDGPARLENSIVVGGDLPSCADGPIDGGHNIAFPDVTCRGAIVSPQLEPLADNGGPTLTEALAPGSPALDAVPGAGARCPATDQRGVTRPHGTACDIGAYEHAAPDVTTNPPTSVSGGGATLNGSVTPNGVHASYHFEYGRTTAYDSATIARTASGSATAATAVTAALTGLAPGTTYHYRLVATNADGTTAGADRTVTTTASTNGTPPRGQLPRFLSASVNPRVFAVKPTTRSRRKRANSHPPFGTTFRYTLSEAAHVTFTIERALPGRTSGRACRAPTKRTRRSRRCTRFVTPRVFTVTAPAGPHATKFDGHIGRTALQPGDYRATLIATDAAKRRSAPKRLTFRIVPP